MDAKKGYEATRRELSERLERLTREFAAAETSGDTMARTRLAKEVDEASAAIEELDRGNRAAA